MNPFLASLFIAMTAWAAPASAQEIFSDSFESGDLHPSDETGFDWGGTHRTSLVKQDPSLGNVILYLSNQQVEMLEEPNRDWRALDGDVSLRFEYLAGKNMAEQRFSFDNAYPELWIRYWLKVPTNFKHPSTSPTNNKLFALWMDGYSSNGNGPTMAWEFWGDDSGGSNLAYHYVNGGKKGLGPHLQFTPFITYPDDQGRWMQVTIRAKASSSSASSDGVIQLYRRWAGESSHTLIHDDKHADIPSPSGGPNGWAAGYFMGWSNPGYADDTEWLLDDVVFSGSSLLGDTTLVDDTGSCQAPRPPAILTHANP